MVDVGTPLWVFSNHALGLWPVQDRHVARSSLGSAPNQCHQRRPVLWLLTVRWCTQVAISRPAALTAEEQVDEAVFQQAFIPRKLEEVEHFERDSERLVRGESKDIYFQTITGMARDGTGAGVVPKVLLQAAEGGVATVGSSSDAAVHEPAMDVGGDGDVHDTAKALPGVHGVVHESIRKEEDDLESTSQSGSDDSGDEPVWEERPAMSAEETKQARKANKKAVKEEHREKRKTKLPKKAKKRAEKKGKVKK